MGKFSLSCELNQRDAVSRLAEFGLSTALKRDAALPVVVRCVLPSTMSPILRFVLSTVVLSYLGSNGVSASEDDPPGGGGGVPGGGGGVPGGGGGGFFDPPDEPPSPPPPSPSPPPPSRPPPPEPPQRPPLFPGYTSVFASVCHNECLAFANNGVCEDGGDGSSFFDCDLCAAPSPPELNPCVC